MVKIELTDEESDLITQVLIPNFRKALMAAFNCNPLYDKKHHMAIIDVVVSINRKINEGMKL